MNMKNKSYDLKVVVNDNLPDTFMYPPNAPERQKSPFSLSYKAKILRGKTITVWSYIYPYYNADSGTKEIWVYYKDTKSQELIPSELCTVVDSKPIQEDD